MSGNTILNQVIVLFLVMIVGFCARKLDIIDEQVNKKLSELLLNITMPFMIISSFHFRFTEDMLVKAGIIFISSLGIHAFSILLGMLLYCRYPEDIRKVLRFITVFSNCGFMGFPVLESVYGKIGVFYASIYVVSFNIFLWTYGIMLFANRKDMKSFRKVLVNPGIIAVFIGMIIFLFSIELPAPVFKAIDMVGSMTTPLSMLIVGALLAESSLKAIFSGFTVYYGAMVRLVILPALSMILLKLAGLSGTLMNVNVILVAMPAAANTVIFAEKYEGNAKFASRCVAISTILSIATIPAIMMLL